MSDTQRFGTVVVAPPNRPPRGATLLRSVNPVTPSGPEVEGGAERWVRGILWQPDSCGDGEIVHATGLCGGGAFAGFDVADRPDLVEYVPPFVAVGQNCSGISGEAELQRTAQRARELLERCQTVGIARELWRGDVAEAADPDLPNDWLAKDASDVGGGAPQPVRDAFAALEQGLADCSCGGQGVIHAMPYLATLWASLQLVERQPDGRLLSALGTVVVADPGYDGSGEDGGSGDPLASSWAYATAMVDVRLGAIAVTNDASTLNLSTNDFDVYAYRPFAATFDPCCHLGVQVDHTDRS